ncbi:glucose-1-phosphate thymidylyltransferase [Patescibacteria group bacterium]|nr:glucose-1-phosphate thymidylyltransferase [Patescibacteria group bacterium]
MKALIAAGGHGTRLRPITFTLNKHLIPIANKPMIFHALDKMAEAGIKEVGINVNPGDTSISKACGNGEDFGLNITYIEQSGGPLGLAHIIKNAESFIGDEDFIFYLGDNIILGSIKPFIKKFKDEKADCLLALSRVEDPERFGVPDIDEKGNIIGVEEKPKRPKSPYAVTGIYIYNKSIFDAVKKLKPSARGELEISDAHQYLIDHGYKVTFVEITGWWKDTGKPDDLIQGNQLLLNDITSTQEGAIVDEHVQIQGKVSIAKGAKILGRSYIRGPVMIGPCAVIRDSYIGPFTSVGGRVEISGGEIENSIVFDDADISCKRKIVDSLLGKNCTITDAHATLPSGNRLIVGENSIVEL